MQEAKRGIENGIYFLLVSNKLQNRTPIGTRLAIQRAKSFLHMNIINSICFLVLGVIMRLLPAYAESDVAYAASDVAKNVAVSEYSLRELFCVALGCLFCAIGAWFLLKEIKRRVAPAVARVVHCMRIRNRRATRALAHAHA